MIPKAIRRFAILCALLAVPVALRAGANTWTATSPLARAVSADPRDPYTVYALFGNDLRRSGDGGRTWVFLRSFDNAQTMLVHPASPSTIFVAGASNGQNGLYRSRDGGATWTITLKDRFPTSLAGSQHDPDVVFAGDHGHVYKSPDGGETWNQAEFVGTVASLVLDPRNPSIAYAGGEGFEYFGDYPGSLGKTMDGGAHWRDTAPGPIDSAFAVAVDRSASSTVYAAIGPYTFGKGSLNTAPEVLRSEDGGASWTSASTGLPGRNINSIATDPRASGGLYAGTDAGLYRSLDAGRTWTPFGQQLAGAQIRSVWIADSGAKLYAASTYGVHELELARGPLDIAAGRSGASRILAWGGDRLSLGTLDVSGSWSAVVSKNASAVWTAVAVAEAGDRTHVLWQDGGGRSALEAVGPAGRESTAVFAARPGWMPLDVSARGDGDANLLWTSFGGAMHIERANGAGTVSVGPEYGPYDGWSAIAIADGAAGDTWVLWRSTDARAALSLHHEGVMSLSIRLGAYLDWSADDVAVGTDGRPRLLRTSPAGLASVVTIDDSGLPVSGARYTLPGFTPRRIAAGADGATRLLFSTDDGQGEVLLLDASNRLTSKKAVHPLADIVVDDTFGLEQAMQPANAGKQILVKAGEYAISVPLTVPDGATVVGEGEMLFEADGLPAGIAAAGRTLIESTNDLFGDVLTLGNGSAIRGLVIADAEGRGTGNPVAVVSRGPNDLVAASIEACEIVNPNPSGIFPGGPTGRGLVVVNRNPNLSADPPPHEGAALSVRMRNSLVHSPAAAIGVFAINFASQASIDLDLSGNVIGGGLTAAGGVSRPDAVSGASIRVKSRSNLYRSDSADPTPLGWNLSGGSTAPIPNIVSEASTSNSLTVQSVGDRIEGFAFGISASGGQRLVATSQPISSNSLELNLQGTRLQSLAADLSLFGGFSLAPGVSPGDGNVLRLNMRQATGSGPRDNAYVDSSEGLGADNRLVVVGNPNAFEQTNQGIDPRPPDQFFTSPQ